MESIFLLICWLSMSIALVVEKRDTKQSYIIGIDLGTTFSCIGVLENKNVSIIPTEDGERLLPNFVSFTDDDGQLLVGEAARNQLATNPQNTIFGVKRLIGRSWDDPSVQHYAKRFPFKLVEKNKKPHIKIANGTLFALEDILAIILTKLKAMAENYLGEPVVEAVATVPAHFNDAQRYAIKDAGSIAGLIVRQIINEPTAAGIANGLEQIDMRQERFIAVLHLGGGTLDVSLLIAEHGIYEVVATNGDAHLGGDNFDERVLDYLITAHYRNTGEDLRLNQIAVQKLKRQVERAKRVLDSQFEVDIEIEGEKGFFEKLTRSKLEQLNADLFQSIISHIQQVLDDANVTKSQIDDILLIGGSSQIPKIQQLVRDFFDDKETISRGVNPDEAVAHGAAIQGGVLAGEGDNPCYFPDIIPLTLGIETADGTIASVARRYLMIPLRRSQTFSTVVDNQTNVTINVFEGERFLAKDNHLVVSLVLTDLPPLPQGFPQIEVQLEIDVNGMLIVNITEKLSKIKNSTTILFLYSPRLSDEDIDQMRLEAEVFAEEDDRARTWFDSRSNRLDRYLSFLTPNLETCSAGDLLRLPFLKS